MAQHGDKGAINISEDEVEMEKQGVLALGSPRLGFGRGTSLGPLSFAIIVVI